MRNPLRKRHLRELRSDLGKYIVIFLLLLISIGLVSGFEVADNSMIFAYNESFEKYNVEDGDFIAENEMTRQQRALVQSHGISACELFYYETEFSNGADIRIFKKRDRVNLECLMSGAFPENEGEIAIDRMYADNAGLAEGDTLTAGDGTSYTITGLVALSDYSTLFQNNNDIMFDSSKFCVAIVSEQQFELYDKESLTYCYAWKYDDASVVGSDREKDVSEDLMYALGDDVVLESFIPRYQNQAITFTGDDMGSDAAMMQVFLYIIVVIIAFVFAVTTKDTIQKESQVIGTLRASGYTRRELVRHYIVMPVLVTLISAVVANILGYTLMKDMCAGLYYGSYSLPTYVTVWNADAFVETTAVPCLIMAAVTWLVLRKSLSLPVQQFLRGEPTGRKNKRAVRLRHASPFMRRFRLRVIMQNIPNYLILFIGILFGNILLMFGLALPELLTDYQESIGENMIAGYQTLLSVPSDATDEDDKLGSMVSLIDFDKAVETKNETAEKFSAYELKTPESDEYRNEEIMFYGIADDSDYVTLPEDGVYISYLYADKYEIGAGDSITLYEEYEDKTYTFEISGVLDYRGAVCVFMPMDVMNETFGLDEDFYSGYFSETPIEDIDDRYIGSVIDFDSLTKVSRQLMISMGSMMYILDAFCVIMFVVLMYLLSKMIIEKNSHSISITKILGYTNREISKLYVRAITIVAVACVLLTIPICAVVLKIVFRVMMRQMMSGWLLISVSAKTCITMAVLGIASYAVVAIIEMHRIRKIPMDKALKVVE